MQDEDSFTFQLNKSQVLPTRSTEVSLITLERSQKLDLLIHLISNLRQSLVISGPSGIGKTTLLDELKARKDDVWTVLTIKASDNLSFESIQKQIQQFLTKNYPEYKDQNLTDVLSAIDKQGLKIIVLIDEAGQLVPGLISSIIQYAASCECLRIVFSLTQDELHLKNSSDKSIDDCHFIEIPPLTEKQCGVFLQNLSAKPNAVISFNAISEQMIEKVYQRTHGIPGKIIAELPRLSNYKSAASYKWIVAVFFITIIIVIGVKLFLIDEPDITEEKAKISKALILKKAEVVDISSPVIHSTIEEPKAYQEIEPEIIIPKIDLKKELPPSDDIAVDTDRGVDKIDVDQVKSIKLNIKPVEVDGIDNIQLVNDAITEKKVIYPELLLKEDKINHGVVKEAPVIKKKKPVDLPLNEKKLGNKLVKPTVAVAPKQDDSLWILNQPKQNYTIQLIVLSKRESVDEFVTKNSGLKDRLKFFKVNKQSQKYVLIYGSFKSSESASKQMKQLPSGYRKSWIRKLSDLQKEIKK